MKRVWIRRFLSYRTAERSDMERYETMTAEEPLDTMHYPA